MDLLNRLLHAPQAIAGVIIGIIGLFSVFGHPFTAEQSAAILAFSGAIVVFLEAITGNIPLNPPPAPQA